MYGMATLTIVVSRVCISVAAITQTVMIVLFAMFEASAVDGTVMVIRPAS